MKNQTISTQDLATISGLSDRRLRQLASEGHLPPPKRGQWQHPATLQRLFAYLKERSAPTAMTAAKLERAQSQARIAKVAADLAEGKVWNAEAAGRELTTAIVAAKNFFYWEMPGQVAELGRMHHALTVPQSDGIRSLIRNQVQVGLQKLHAGEFIKTECSKTKTAIKKL